MINGFLKTDRQNPHTNQPKQIIQLKDHPNKRIFNRQTIDKQTDDAVQPTIDDHPINGQTDRLIR